MKVNNTRRVSTVQRCVTDHVTLDAVEFLLVRLWTHFVIALYVRPLVDARRNARRWDADEGASTHAPPEAAAQAIHVADRFLLSC